MLVNQPHTFAADQFRINPAELRQWTVLTPTRSFGAIALNWAIIAAAIGLHQAWPNALSWLVAWFLVATRLYAFYSLMHEAVHGLLIRNRRLNDIAGQVFLGLPLFIHLKAMRAVHFAHHRHLQTEGDPELAHLRYREFLYPKTKSRLVLLFLLDLSGINFLYYRIRKWKMYFIQAVSGRQPDVGTGQVLLTLFYILLFTASILFGFWKAMLLYWIIPYATLYQLLNRIRLTAEHFYLDRDDAYPARSVLLPPVLAFFVAPHGLGFHAEHHHYPGVPFYRLHALHLSLMARPGYAASHLVEHSYLSIFRKLVKS